MDMHSSVAPYRCRQWHIEFVFAESTMTFCNFKTLCADNKNATECQAPPVFATSPLPSSLNQNSQNGVVLFACFGPKWNVTPKSSRCREISSFVFTFYLYKSQNRIPLREISATVCFKCKTNTFLTQVFKIQISVIMQDKSNVEIPESNEYFIVKHRSSHI